jgi:HlyD family secretion protein
VTARPVLPQPVLPLPVPRDAGWRARVDPSPEPTLRNTMLAALATVVFGVGGFLGWATTADLDSAAVAAGTVIVDSHRKTVSHLEGGTLRALMVREGDLVEAGQPLLLFETTQSGSVVAQIEGQFWLSVARLARLQSELADAEAPAFPADLRAVAATMPVAAEGIDLETRLMTARRETLAGQIAVLRRRIGQLRNEIDAHRAQRAATAERLRYTEEEMGAVRQLLDRGYERRPRLLELQRTVADLRGRLGELAANTAQAEQAIAGAELEILNLAANRRSEATDELQRTRASVADLTERLRAAADVLRRQTVLSPQAGKVTNIRYFTPGSAVAGGAPILDIVPQDDELIVEARVATTDIDSVRPGQPALVRLTAYKQRTVPPVEGEVVEVSADQLTDERTGAPHYTARVRLRPDALKDLAGVRLYPGMPAEVLIRSRPRKAIDYFLAPLTDSLRRSMREE